MESHKIIQVEEKVPLKLLLPLSIQHMFAMFGASVLVPFIFGINPAIVLFMNGVGTLIFIAVTKAKSPKAYLGSSFAFLAPRQVLLSVRWDIRMHWEDLLRSVYADVFCPLLFTNAEQSGLISYSRLSGYGTGCCIDRSGIVWFGCK